MRRFLVFAMILSIHLVHAADIEVGSSSAPDGYPFGC